MATLKTCSMTWEAAVGFMFCLPWKYPLKADMRGQRRRAGAMAFMDQMASGVSM